MHKHLLLALALLGAGCLDQPATPTDDLPSTAQDPGQPVPANGTRPGDEPPAVLATKNGTFGWVVGATAGPARTAVHMEVGDRLIMEVPEGSRMLEASAGWRCTAVLCDVQAFVYPGDDPQEFMTSWPADAAHAAGTGRLLVQVADPEPGPYTMVVVSTTASAVVIGDLRMTAFA